MQKPIRYYITKDGDEPTVRSVEVALGTPEVADTPDIVSPPNPESQGARRSVVGPVRGVKRLVKESVQFPMPRR